MKNARQFKSYIKHVVYFLLFYSGALHLLISIGEKIRRYHPIIILFYHRFHRRNEKDHLLPSQEISEFQKQMRHLKRFYEFISIDELVNRVKNACNLVKPALALTIDDGYLSNYTLAYPVIKQYHIPCTIYLTTGLIGPGSGLWVDDIEYALMNTKAQTLSFQELFGDEVFDISASQSKIKVLEMLYFSILKLGPLERKTLIQKLFGLLKVDISALKKRQRIMLNWDEILKMSNNGVTYGAHTVSHPCLPIMTSENAEYEIRESKTTIEKYIRKPVKHFAIPNGRSEDFTDDLKAYCDGIGFDTIVTTEPGVVDLNSDRLALRRMIFPSPLYYFACEIARHFFFKILIRGKSYSHNR